MHARVGGRGAGAVRASARMVHLARSVLRLSTSSVRAIRTIGRKTDLRRVTSCDGATRLHLLFSSALCSDQLISSCPLFFLFVLFTIFLFWPAFLLLFAHFRHSVCLWGGFAFRKGDEYNIKLRNKGNKFSLNNGAETWKNRCGSAAIASVTEIDRSQPTLGPEEQLSDAELMAGPWGRGC